MKQKEMCLAVGTASKNHHHFVTQSQESNVNPGFHALFFIIVLGWREIVCLFYTITDCEIAIVFQYMTRRNVPSLLTERILF